MTKPVTAESTATASRASWVALGILCSRLAGLVREGVVTAVIGVGALGDVVSTAFRLPNLLQSMLGEQTLSASFIPVYSRLLGEGKKEEAGRFAGAIFGLLVAAAGLLSLTGVLLAEPIVALFTPGYLRDASAVALGTATVDRYPLAVTAVRIVFPMSGVMVLSAWCLGILNSHRRFFLPYVAPVVWNIAIITALVMASGLWLGIEPMASGVQGIVVWACVGALVGGILQFALQAPVVLSLLRGFRISFSTRVAGVGEALKAFGPIVWARGAAQMSSYFDQFLGSLLVAGAVGALRWGGILYLLPISLFSLSVAAAELPEMSRREGGGRDGLAARVESSLRQIGFLIVPTSVGYIAFGFLIVGLVFRRGRFGIEDNWLTYLVLAGYALGLVATSWSRLLSNAYYSQGETRRPATIAVGRLLCSATLGAGLMLLLDRYAVADFTGGVVEGRLHLGAVGLSLASGVVAWLELAALRFGLRELIPDLRLPIRGALECVGVAFMSLIPAALSWWLFDDLPVFLTAIAVLAAFAAFYLGLSQMLGTSQLEAWSAAFRRRR